MFAYDPFTGFQVRMGLLGNPNEVEQVHLLYQIFAQWGVVGWRMVLGKLPVLGGPTNLEYSRARAYCAYSRCGWGLFGHFFSHLSFLSSFSLSLGDGPI